MVMVPNPLATTETFYADLVYLQRQVNECRHGFRMLAASASLVSLPWSVEVNELLLRASLMGHWSSGDIDACILSAMTTLLAYIERLNET